MLNIAQIRCLVGDAEYSASFVVHAQQQDSTSSASSGGCGLCCHVVHGDIQSIEFAKLLGDGDGAGSFGRTAHTRVHVTRSTRVVCWVEVHRGIP